MSVIGSNGVSPWSRQVDRVLSDAIEDQVINRQQAANLKGRLASAALPDPADPAEAGKSEKAKAKAKAKVIEGER